MPYLSNQTVYTTNCNIRHAPYLTVEEVAFAVCGRIQAFPAQGENNTVRVTVRNRGQATCYGALVRFYRCPTGADGQPDASAPTLLGWTITKRIKPGKTETANCPVPLTMPSIGTGLTGWLVVVVSDPITDPAGLAGTSSRQTAVYPLGIAPFIGTWTGYVDREADVLGPGRFMARFEISDGPGCGDLVVKTYLQVSGGLPAKPQYTNIVLWCHTLTFQVTEPWRVSDYSLSLADPDKLAVHIADHFNDGRGESRLTGLLARA